MIGVRPTAIHTSSCIRGVQYRTLYGHRDWLLLVLFCYYSSVNIATKLRAGRPEFDSRQGLGIFLITTASRLALASYPVGIKGFSPGVKRPEHEANHSSSSGVEVKNALSYTSTDIYVFIEWCLVKPKDFTLPLLL
jgi:hypothetical protein